MKKKKRFSNFLCVMTVLLGIGGFICVAEAATISFDVTASNVSGVTSKDPYSYYTTKDDSEQNFYIKVTSLSNGSSMTFTSYNGDGTRVSEGLTVTSSEVGTTKKKAYSVTAISGALYRIYATVPLYSANVHAVGNYCP